MGAAGIPCDALSVRYSVMERDAVQEKLRSMLDAHKPPTALIGYPYPEEISWVEEVASEKGLTVGEDFAYLTQLGATSPSPDNCPVRCCVPPDEVGEHFGRLLATVARGEQPSRAHTVLPVELK
jgi:hypothetical protein